jgi:hypothetical protein
MPAEAACCLLIIEAEKQDSFQNVKPIQQRNHSAEWQCRRDAQDAAKHGGTSTEGA